MKIQVHTDRFVEGSVAFREQTEADLASALTRFEDRLTRVEVHLREERAGRTAGDDFRCLIGARPSGRGTVAVTHRAATLDEALRGATHKLEALLDSMLERREGKATRATIRTAEGPRPELTAPRRPRSPA